MVVTRQNQMKTMKKKIWLIRRAVVIFMAEVQGSGFKGSGFLEFGSGNAEGGIRNIWMSEFHLFRIPHSDFHIHLLISSNLINYLTFQLINYS